MKSKLLYKSLKCLVKQCKILQNHIKEIKLNTSFMKDENYLKEFCTVKMSCARGSGHTYSVLKFASKQAKKGKNIILMYPTNAVTVLARNTFYDRFGRQDNVIFLPMRSPENIRGIEVDYILVDGASHIEPKVIDEIYKNAAPLKDSVIVLVQ